MQPSPSPQPLYAPLKALSLVVVLAMAAALGYAGWISAAYWTGIGV